MDPNKTLQHLLGLVKDAHNVDSMSDHETRDMLVDFATSFEALDEWIHSGGFVPERWEYMP